MWKIQAFNFLWYFNTEKSSIRKLVAKMIRKRYGNMKWSNQKILKHKLYNYIYIYIYDIEMDIRNEAITCNTSQKPQKALERSMRKQPLTQVVVEELEEPTWWCWTMSWWPKGLRCNGILKWGPFTNARFTTPAMQNSIPITFAIPGTVLNLNTSILKFYKKKNNKNFICEIVQIVKLKTN